MGALNLLNRFEIGALLTSLARKANKKKRKEIITLKKKNQSYFTMIGTFLINLMHSLNTT